MKKRIACLILVMIMVSLLVCPAYATEKADSWTLVGDAEYITHGESKYYPMDFSYSSYVVGSLSWEQYELGFSDQKMAQIYEGSYIYVTEGVEEVLEVELYKNGEYVGYFIYVEESHYEEYEQIKNGNANHFVIEDENFEYVPITDSDLEVWSRGERKTIAGDDIDDYFYYYIYACNENETFMHEVGVILADIYDYDLYLLKYDECEPHCFNEYNSFIGDPLASYSIYDIENDEELREMLSIEDYGITIDMSPEAVGTTFAIVFISIIFGAIPLAIITFAIVKFIRCKDKKYRAPYIVLTIGASLMLMAYVVLLALLVV